jgi:tRNA-specific 2-thiouridylase
MLAGLRRDQLASIVAPLGTYTKEETRSLAARMELGVADKPDSMDLCFVDSDYRGFILRRHPDAAAPGPILTVDGDVVGTHDGLINYTVGQRKGIATAGLGDGPWYVVRTQREENAVVIGRRDDLARDSVLCSAANVIDARAFASGAARGLAVCRYRGAPVPATARVVSGGQLFVQFDQPVSVVSPGQLLAFYDSDDREVLASGVIEPDEAAAAAAG